MGTEADMSAVVAKRYHPARVRFHLHEVQGDILVEPVEEWDPFTDLRDATSRRPHKPPV